jgi:hypothetical protein
VHGRHRKQNLRRLVHRLLILRRLVDCLERTSLFDKHEPVPKENRHEEIGEHAMAALNSYG